MNLKQEIEAIAREREIDLVGFARVSDIQLAYPPRPAEDLLPGAKTVVVFAAALLQGALECPRGTKGAIKDAQVAYDRIQEAAAAVGRFLERQKYVSYFPPASMPTDAYKHNGVTHFAAEFSHRQAAIAAGLGVKGWNNLLITPEFGPRVRLGSMITTAEFDFEPRKLPEKVCTQCRKCIEICPVGALNPERERYLEQPNCKNHYIRPYLDHTPWQTVKNVFTVECYAVMGMQVLMEGYHFSCAECQRVCPVGKI
jgi:epoxyqueuosine reductase